MCKKSGVLKKWSLAWTITDSPFKKDIRLKFFHEIEQKIDLKLMMIVTFMKL